MANLSENQEKVLLRLFNGDIARPTIEGYFWNADQEKVDGRTVNSLIERRLVSVATGAALGMVSQGLSLTKIGADIARELDEAAYQNLRRHRGW